MRLPAPPAASAPPSTARLALRGAVALGVAAFLIGAPAARQLGGVRDPYLPQWVMFVGYGLDVCAVDYWARGPEGDAEVDRFEVLDLRWVDAPRDVKRVASPAEAARLGRRLCAKLGAGADLRMDLRCAARTGWTVEAAREEDLCAQRARPKAAAGAGEDEARGVKPRPTAEELDGAAAPAAEALP
ncbi:MAG: hypothetical protein RL071_1020 [Pseudomonadota bacterium]|jgi:hypothetical protein